MTQFSSDRCEGCKRPLAGYQGGAIVDDLRRIGIEGETVTRTDGECVVLCERCPNWLAETEQYA